MLGEGDNFEGIIDVIEKKAYTYEDDEKKEVEIPEIRLAEVDEVYNQVIEAVAESDDSLMEKFFEGEEFSEEEFMKGLSKAILQGDVVPLIAGSSEKQIGLTSLLDTIIKYMPSIDDEAANIGYRVKEDYKVFDPKEDSPFSAVVFKTIADPFVGKISIFKVCLLYTSDAADDCCRV